MKQIDLNGDWQVVSVNDPKDARALSLGAQPEDAYPAVVPGDIHVDLLAAGKIPDPFFGDNIKKIKWVADHHWCYIKTFEVPDGFSDAITELHFNGIDTFADVYLNGELVGSAHNMFYRYAFAVGHVLKKRNILCVVLKSITEEIEKLPHEGYTSCFHHERIFIRKPQCHFSWDWAPELFATGIYDEVTLTSMSSEPIQNIAVRTRNDGSAAFLFEFGDDFLSEGTREIALSLRGPGHASSHRITGMGKRGAKQFLCRVDNPRLWWPVGYGEQPLYAYEATLLCDGRPVHTLAGTFAFREIEIDQSPLDDDSALRFLVRVNGMPVFLKGANWVPADIFTGTVDRAKYDELLTLLVDGNMNCLRIWGGGLYEKDAFYELCDEKGILIWQDFMFSCAELPDDYPGFYDEVTRELVQQLTRLRNHPCIFMWCGGNERPGGIADEDCRGEDKFKFLFRGIAGHMDPTRPYTYSSPFGYERPGNSYTSGDAHYSSVTAVFEEHASRYKELLAGIKAPMMTEIVSMGSSPVENIYRYIPEGSLWPPDDIWVLHIRGNPYDGLDENFVIQQMRLAGQHFGPINSLNDFAKKTSLLQAEHIKADVEFHRSRAMDCSGALIWMYNDIWPCGSWAMIDYYRSKKAGYYAMKAACRPVLPIIALHQDGLRAFVANDTGDTLQGVVEITQQNTAGVTVARFEYPVTALPNASTAVCRLSDFDADLPNTMFFITLRTASLCVANSYIHLPFAALEFQADSVCATEITGEAGRYAVTLKSGAVARSVYLRAKGADFDDNYFDMPAHSTCRVAFRCEYAPALTDIVVRTYPDEWESIVSAPKRSNVG